MKRKTFASASKWESIVGYSRAVRVGNIIEVSGTTASDEHGNIHGIGDAYLQTKYIFEKIENVLKEAGSGLGDVVRTRIFVTDIGCWEEIGKAHHEFFADIKPATSMLQVQKLIGDELLVEIEVSAIVSSQ